MFSKVKQQVKKKFEDLAKGPLFYATIDREALYAAYLDGFDDPAERQSHDCNACKSFIRQWGGIVGIVDGQRVSIWDVIPEDAEYLKPIANMSRYVHSLELDNVFLTSESKCGTDTNYDNKHQMERNHFYIEVPSRFVANGATIDSVRGQKRDDKNVLKRSLDEFTIEAVDTILDLIAQNSLYRGKEIENNIKQFQDIKLAYDKLESDLEKENYCWITAATTNISRIRNTAAGTLLIDLSEGKMDLDTAISRWEKVMAPTNYKRPTALVTPAMIEAAKSKLDELGLTGSLDRRFANEADLNLEDIIYVDKSSNLTGDVFGEMTKDALVNPRSFSKVESITIEEFLSKVVPTSSSIEMLVENQHLNNFVSLVTSQEKEAPSLFKWNNNFSWAYSGGITDSIKERVKAAGGDVSGVLRFSIQWNDEDTKGIVDLDAHAIQPDGREIMYNSYRGVNKTPMTGNLDVDMINPTNVGVENITWSDLNKMGNGTYRFFVRNFNGMRHGGFKAQIEFNGEIYDFHYPKHYLGDIQVAEVVLKDGVFTLVPKLEANSTLTSKVKWGVKTNQFTKVKQIMLSPNHWDKATGNKHYMFFLENAINDEVVRPFFNEFLRDEFNENRKVFEVLGSKVKIEPTDNQLSGVGFSETQTNHVFVKVKGNFERVLKIVF